METKVMPFFLDWNFWVAFGTVSALVLSQLPPIKTWFRRANLLIDVHIQGWLVHKLGYPNFQIHLSLRNTGGKVARIKRIDLSIQRDDKIVCTLPARTHRSLQKDKDVLFMPFSIAPQDEWGNIVTFFEILRREDNQQISDVVTSMRQDILAKRQLLGPDEQNIDVEADAALSQRASQIFAEKFIWRAGEYTIKVLVKTEGKKADAESSYRFTLFESDEAALRKFLEDYRFGYGVILDPRQPGVFVQLKATDGAISP